MFNNFKYLMVAFFAAMLLTLVGVALRFMHVPIAGFLISSMLMAQAVALVAMIVLMFRKRS
jgi:hypothetical protein